MSRFGKSCIFFDTEFELDYDSKLIFNAASIYRFKAPFMREGLMEEYGIGNLEQASTESFLQQITDNFEPMLKEATRAGLIFGGELQAVLNQEMIDHVVRDEVLEMLKPIIKPAVVNVMTWLHTKGWSAPGVAHDYIITKFVKGDIWGKHRKSIDGDSTYEALATKFQNLIDPDFPLSKLRLNSLSNLLDIFKPEIHKYLFEEVDEFRKQNPQFSDCGASVFAATVVGTLKSTVLDITRKFLEEEYNGTIDEQAAMEQIAEKANESVVTAIELEAHEIRGWDSGKFADSDEYDDIKARVDSGLYNIIMKEMEKHNKKQEE